MSAVGPRKGHTARPRALSLLAIALTTLSTAACATGDNLAGSGADYVEYSSAEELVEASNVVIVGTFISDRSELLQPTQIDSDDPTLNPQAGATQTDDPDDTGVPVTISEIRVEEVLLGKVEVGDTIAVTQVGGEIEGVTYADSQLPPLSTAKDSSLLLALAEFEDGTLAPLNPSQAVLVVASDGTLSPLGESDGIPGFPDLTLDTLRSHTSGR